MTNLGLLSSYLGMEVHQCEFQIILSQNPMLNANRFDIFGEYSK